MTARYELPVLRLPLNELGTDYVVGDVHGCFDQVIEGMRRVGFDRGTDRLLCVGDLIDRGPGSARTAAFLAQPYVHAARGNHEDMVLELHEDGEPVPATLAWAMRHNGFSWWRDASPEVRTAVLDAVRPLPIAIEVETRRGRVGIVHADVPAGMDWPTFTRRLEARDMAVAEVALWGRDRLHAHDLSGIAGIDRVFVGHTPVARTTRIGNVFAIDTGCVFGVTRDDGVLTFSDLCTSTNAFTTMGSMTRSGFVGVVSDERTERPFSHLLGR